METMMTMDPLNDELSASAEEPSSFDLYKLYLETAEKVSDRRAQSNAWMLSVNTAIVGFYGYLNTEELLQANAVKAVWLWAIPAAGVIVCVAWIALLTSYSRLNSAKFKVLQELEVKYPVPLFKRESEHYRNTRRRRFSRIERGVPWTFVLLHSGVLFASVQP